MRAPEQESLARRLGLEPIPRRGPEDEPAAVEQPIALSIRALRRFLECPLQGWAEVMLRLREIDGDDPLNLLAEPFRCDRGPEVGMLRSVMAQHLHLGGDDAELLAGYREQAELEELSGRAPTGLFAERSRLRQAALLSTWRRLLVERVGSLPSVRTESYGQNRGQAGVADLLPPVSLATRGRTIELYGITELLAGAAIGSITFVARAPLQKDFLRGFLDGALLAAAGHGDPVGHVATVVGDGVTAARRFPAWSASEARTYLTHLADELYFATHAYLLPCEAVFAAALTPEVPIAEVITRLTSGHGKSSSAYGPVKRLADLGPPPDADAIASRRFAHFLAAEVLP
jgi:exodeoxyribonuclease V gamma subunit